jgi:hypothetical protein
MHDFPSFSKNVLQAPWACSGFVLFRGDLPRFTVAQSQGEDHRRLFALLQKSFAVPPSGDDQSRPLEGSITNLFIVMALMTQ